VCFAIVKHQARELHLPPTEGEEVSSTAASRTFPWQVIRGPAALFACYVAGFNVLHHVDHYQWWGTFGPALLALLTTAFEGIYDEPLPGKLFGPRNMSNFTCMLLSLAIPATVFVCGIIKGNGLWWVGGLAVLGLNGLLYFGFRQRGLTGTVVVACLLGLTVF